MTLSSSPPPNVEILVIGGASLDVLHLADGQTVKSPGGAGLYTALAAHKAGVHVAMFAPRPEPMPAELREAAHRLRWHGPIVSPEQLPHFEIAHHGGGRATLVEAFWGGEMLITPDALQPDQIDAAIVHIAALRTAERQLNFARMLRRQGIHLSAGTYGKICANEPATVRAVFELADYFFMNENEAALIFGSIERARTQPGHILFITLSARGALIVQGDHITRVPGLPAAEVDPTGAGDTFCGATLAALARGEHPIMAARGAVVLAAEMIGEVGPARLLSDRPAPRPPADPRVRVNPEQIDHVGALIAHLPDVQPFDFTGELLPPIDHPRALDYFFAATLQQFGFWEMKEINCPDARNAKLDKESVAAFTPSRRYSQPMIAALGGRSLKGSDYLWAAYQRALKHDPDFATPMRQAALTLEDLTALFRADDGVQPMPALEIHVQQANAYGWDMLALGWTPQSIVAEANRSAHPRRTLLTRLDHVGGYKEDPLRKKSMLLALILAQRPEHFLRTVADDADSPVIDYHLMRSCLRTGLIEITDDDLRAHVVRREELCENDEWAIRLAAYEAIQQVQRRSGCSLGAVDWFFFNARRRCPEMTEPDCAHCAVDPACAHRKELFQPVRRTVFY